MSKIMIHIFRTFRSRSTIAAFPVWFWVLISCFSVAQAQYKMENSATGSSYQSNISKNANYQVQAVIGQTFALSRTEATSNAATLGLFSYYVKEPGAPFVVTTQGDFPDRVEITWQWDILSPSNNTGSIEVFRDGVLIATLPRTQKFYQDYNVFPGKYYLYEIVGQNSFGKSPRGASVGFVNPNGIITGAITTSFGRPVFDVEVGITPTLGKALKFDNQNMYVDAGYNLRLNERSFTVEFWLKRPSNPSPNVSMLVQNPTAAAGTPQLTIGYLTGNNLVFGFSTTDFLVVNDTSALNDWHHYAFVYDMQKRKRYIYIDGKVRDSGATAQNLPYYSEGGQLWLGKGLASNNYFLDEMRVWEAALDEAGIRRNMRRTVNTDSENLIAYWKFDEGLGDIVFDLSPNTHNGKMMNMPVTQFVNDRAPVRTSAYTDVNGNYTIEGINYGSSTNFSVTPVREGRVFSPPTRIVTLSSSNTAANNIDFTDISQIPVSGFVRHSGTQCPVDSVEILFNGESMVPPVFTNAEGRYIIEFEPGSSATLKPSRPGYNFAPAEVNYVNVVEPKGNQNYFQAKQFRFSGTVAGGDCDHPIGPVRVILKGIADNQECKVDTFLTDSGGFFDFPLLPPLKYNVIIQPLNPIWVDSIRTDVIDLRNSDIAKQYRYYAPIKVVADGIPVDPACPPGINFPLLGQFEKLPVTYRVFEEYVYDGITNICLVDTAIVTIYDGFGDLENSPRDMTLAGGSGTDTIITGYPAISVVGYTKQFQVVANHRDGRSAQQTYRAIITGFKPQTGSFVTTSPELPMLILRDPPGDGSYSFVSQETSTKQKWSMFGQSTTTNGYNVDMFLAPDFDFESGFIFSTKTEIDNTLNMSRYSSTSFRGKSVNEIEMELKVTETFKTDDNQGITGSEGDVIIGGALNLTYALTDVLTYDAATCSLKKSQTVTFAPTGFETIYYYTTNYIKGVLIPRLSLFPDSLEQVQNWEKILALNDTLKARAEFERNLSFSAGSTIEYMQSSTTTFSDLFEFSVLVESGFESAIGATINGQGVVGGYKMNVAMEFGGEFSNTTTQTNTVGYSFRDDDPGDGVTVDILKDLTYGTPVFRTIAGTTSCPWEPGTQARDIPVITSTNGNAAVNVDPNEPAVFLLSLGNENAAETREYTLRVLNETNPDGAVIAINGIIVQQGINFNVPPGGAVQAVLTVQRGPSAYTYEGLKILFTSPCEFERYQSTGTLFIGDTLSLNVYYKEPCTQVTISDPDPGWIFNSSSGDSLNITLTGYDNENPDLQHIRVEYRRVTPESRPVNKLPDAFENEAERTSYISSVLAAMRLPKGDLQNYDVVSYDHLLELVGMGNQHNNDNPENWFTLKTVNKADLGDFGHIVTWNLEGQADGAYELRAIAFCGPGNTDGVSASVIGIIDRTRPEILGLPEPVDAVLNADDQIKVTFTEDIDCLSIDPLNNIELFNMQNGNSLLFDFTCNGREVLITPQGSYAPFENKVLKAVIKRVKDVNGNIMRVPLGTSYIDSLGWEFLVDRNPVRWTGGEIDVVKYLDETVDMQRTLQNSGSFNQPFTITDLPSWLMPTIISGTVQIQSSTTIGFRFGQDIPAGIYEDTIYAQTINGNEPLIVRLRVLCRPPQWSFNSAAYEFNMNMITELYIDTTLSKDRYDRIAAFSGNELRGTAELQYIQAIDRHLAFITVYSNSPYYEELTFRVWDASECTEYGQIMETFNFKADTVIGSYQMPVRMTATRQIIEEYSFNAGWTWFSLNTKSADMSINTVLASLSPTHLDMIKEQTLFSQYSPAAGYGWVGGLTTLNNKSLYMIRLAQRDTLRRTGYAIDPLTDTLRLAQGWSWIGYTPNADMQINQALASLQASDGDIIKSQTAFSVYAQGIGWIGSLQFMRPRQGYLIKMANAGTLIYPRVSGQQNNISEPDILPGVIPSQPLWTLDRAQYQHTMNIIAKVGGDYADSLRTGDMIALFAGEECRGLAYPVVIPGKKEMYIFLTGYANQASGEFLNMMLWRESSDQVIDLGTGVQFTADGVIGTIEQPMILTPVLSSADDMSGIPAEYSLDQNYPNPFNPTTMIRFGLPEEAEISLTIYNIMGEAVRLLDAGRKNAGYHQSVWDGKNNHGEYVPSGIYFYTLKAGERSFTKKIVFLK